MRLEGTFELITLNQERLAHGGEMMAQQQMMMLPAARHQPAPIPMEIGNLSLRDNNRGRGRGRGQPRGQGRGQSTWRGQPQWRGQGQARGTTTWRGQYRGRGDAHQNYNPANNGRGRGNPRGRPPRPQQERMDVNSTQFSPSTNGCFNCGETGHWARDCTRPRRNQSSFNRGNRGYRGGGGHRVHNIEESILSKN